MRLATLFGCVIVLPVLVASQAQAAGATFSGGDLYGKAPRTSGDPLRQCNGTDPALAITGCTAIIDDRNSTVALRSSALLARGRAYLQRDQADRALADIELAIKLDPKNPVGLANRAYYYQSQGDFGHALEDYNGAIAANPKYFEAYNQRGNLRLQAGDPEKAIPDFDQAIAANPKFAPAFVNRGEAYRLKARPTKRSITSTGRWNRSRLAEAFEYRGVAYVDKADYARAVADFDSALKLNPQMTIVYTHRGMANAASGAKDRALADFDAALKADPNDAFVYVARADLYEKAGDLDRAITDYDKAIMVDRTYADAFNNRGTAYARKGDYNKAVVDFDQAAMLNPPAARRFSPIAAWLT
jgi:tetratricopeptide (TPR) repeat protein